MDKNTPNKAKRFVKSKDTGNPYHNFDHILSVLDRVQKNPLYNSLKEDERILLDLSALFHDAGHSRFNSEEENLAIAVSLLEEFRVSSGDLTVTESEVISELIYSTDNRNLNFVKDDGVYEPYIRVSEGMVQITYLTSLPFQINDGEVQYMEGQNVERPLPSTTENTTIKFYNARMKLMYTKIIEATL